jgi:hypothetical protein
MATRILSRFFEDAIGILGGKTFYEYAVEKLGISEKEACAACSELLNNGVPSKLVGVHEGVLEASAARALCMRPDLYSHFANACPLNARPRILARAAVDAFCKNDIRGLNNACAKIETVEKPALIEKLTAEYLSTWLFENPRTIAFYTRTMVLLSRLNVATHMTPEARTELLYASARGGVFNTVAAMEDAAGQMRVDAFARAQMIECICASGRSKLLLNYLEHASIEKENLRAVLGPRRADVILEAARLGNHGILRILVDEKTEQSELFTAAVWAIRYEQTRVVKFLLQWSSQSSPLRDILKGASALLSGYHTAGVRYYHQDTPARLRGVSLLLEHNLLPEAAALDERAWARVFHSSRAHVTDETAEEESVAYDALLRLFCARELRSALNYAMYAVKPSAEKITQLVQELPCHTRESLKMIEDMCAYTESADFDIEESTALRIVRFAVTQNTVEGLLRVIYSCENDSLATMVDEIIARRCGKQLDILKLGVPWVVESARQRYAKNAEVSKLFQS